MQQLCILLKIWIDIIYLSLKISFSQLLRGNLDSRTISFAAYYLKTYKIYCLTYFGDLRKYAIYLIHEFHTELQRSPVRTSCIILLQSYNIFGRISGTDVATISTVSSNIIYKTSIEEELLPSMALLKALLANLIDRKQLVYIMSETCLYTYLRRLINQPITCSFHLWPVTCSSLRLFKRNIIVNTLKTLIVIIKLNFIYILLICFFHCIAYYVIFCFKLLFVVAVACCESVFYLKIIFVSYF